MDLLDAANIPYGVVPGNHDDEMVAQTITLTLVYHAFAGKSFYGGEYPTGDNQSSYTRFSASGMDFIVINLDYTSPASGLLTWAEGILQANSDHRAIVVSHDIILTGNPASFSSWGQTIYNALNDNPNLFLMLNGHTHGEGQRKDGNIYSLLADYQNDPNGGDGWLRVLEFSPATDTISVKTYSPTLDTYETDADSQFTLSYAMEGSGGGSYEFLGSDTNVASGGTASTIWPGRALGTKYQWYVDVSDGTKTTTGPVWDFTTVEPPPACYALTLTHTGQGTDPVAAPTNSSGCAAGSYHASADIALSGAVPSTGWSITGWTGTSNNSSTAATNSLVMPASAHTAGVEYADTTLPNTTITSQPANPSNSANASFSFTSTEAGSTFECKLDSGTFASCSTPKTYSGLSNGAHTFEVRAIDPENNTDPTPATYGWTIDTTPPNTTITS